MIHNEIKRRYKQEKDLIFPDYEKYCLSNVSPTIEKILGLKTKRPTIQVTAKSEKVVLLLLDGFGFSQWSFQHDLVEAFTKVGDIFPITTVFPSTTAAGVTAVHTGLTPQEHALFEWYMYFNEYDMIIATLPFVSEFDKKRFTKINPNPKILFKQETIYERLKREGIKSYIFVSEKIVKGAYSKLVHKGAIPVPYHNISDLFMHLKQKLILPEKAYYFLYYPEIDSLSHQYGPLSESIDYEKNLVFTALKQFVEGLPANIAKNVTLIISADHGQIRTDKRTVLLNKYHWFDKILKKSKQGRLIQPYGSMRDVFIQVKPEKLEETKERLGKLDAEILDVKEAIKNGLFGLNKASKEFTERAGDIIILPRKNGMIWYKHSKAEDINFLGMHGGLTQDEMLIPLAVINLNELLKALKRPAYFSG